MTARDSPLPGKLRMPAIQKMPYGRFPRGEHFSSCAQNGTVRLGSAKQNSLAKPKSRPFVQGSSIWAPHKYTSEFLNFRRTEPS
jgi:hypothetical protein